MLRSLALHSRAYGRHLPVLLQGSVGAWFLPGLMSRLQETALKLRIIACTRYQVCFDAPAGGDVDPALRIERQKYPPDIELSTLAFVQPVLIARKLPPAGGRVHSSGPRSLPPGFPDPNRQARLSPRTSASAPGRPVWPSFAGGANWPV